MPETSPNERVRRLVIQTFEELGASTTQPPHETILVRDGFYCGHRFEQDRLQAIWFVEEGQVKFSGPDGSLLRVVEPTNSAEDGQRQAA